MAGADSELPSREEVEQCRDRALDLGEPQWLGYQRHRTGANESYPCALVPGQDRHRNTGAARPRCKRLMTAPASLPRTWSSIRTRSGVREVTRSRPSRSPSAIDRSTLSNLWMMCESTIRQCALLPTYRTVRRVFFEAEVLRLLTRAGWSRTSGPLEGRPWRACRSEVTRSPVRGRAKRHATERRPENERLGRLRLSCSKPDPAHQSWSEPSWPRAADGYHRGA